ncbi:MAG: LytR/AlgR family response regulator transcription factor [Saprospiraceae bacterium]
MTSTNKPTILIVEDEMIIAADISMQLTQLGYEVIGIQTKAEDAIKMIASNPPDLILMDIVLKGKMDGIEAAQYIADTSKTPIIFLTSNADDATFQRAIVTKPFAFISKPFQKTELERGLRIAFSHIANEQKEQTKNDDQVTTLNDRLFIRQKDQMVKVSIKDILYLEADRNYCKVYTTEKVYLISTPLGSVEEELPTKSFIRIHRSFVINIEKIDAISDLREYLVINNVNIPISRRNRENILKYLKLI